MTIAKRGSFVTVHRTVGVPLLRTDSESRSEYSNGEKEVHTAAGAKTLGNRSRGQFATNV